MRQGLHQKVNADSGDEKAQYLGKYHADGLTENSIDLIAELKYQPRGPEDHSYGTRRYKQTIFGKSH